MGARARAIGLPDLVVRLLSRWYSSQQEVSVQMTKIYNLNAEIWFVRQTLFSAPSQTFHLKF